MESTLKGWLGRLAGAGLMLLCACAWASLVSWSASDPALVSASDTAFNFLGPVGAIAADWLLQCLGFAAAIALFAPSTWAAEAIAGNALPSRHQRYFLWPMSVLATAGAMAALPAPSSWPLDHGLGGLLGDRLLASLAGLLATAGMGANPLIAGTILGIAALGFCIPLLGIRRWDSVAILRRGASLKQDTDLGPTLADSWPDENGEPSSFDPDAIIVDAQPKPKRAAKLSLRQGHAPALTPAGTDHDEDPALGAGFGSSEPFVSVEPEPELGPAFSDPPEPLPLPRVVKAMKPLHVPYAQDFADEFSSDLHGDDDDSRHIARRFAPGRSQPVDEAELNEGTMNWRRPWRRKADPAPADLGDDPTRHDRTTLALDPAADALSEQEPPALGTVKAVSAANSPGQAPRTSAGPAKQTGYRLPALTLLNAGTATRPGADLQPAALKARALQLEAVLSEFGIKGRIAAARPGPVVTLFELEPAPGLKTGRVVGLADDIARSMAAKSARIAAVPGRNLIGIELPNERRETVYLRELLESDAFKRSTASLPIVIGKAIEGEPVIADLARMPHLLIAGTTGSGKSVGVNAMILSLLFKFTPEQCRMILIDPKVLELSAYSDIPHLLTPIVTDSKKAVAALGWAVSEMEERYKRMAQLNVRNVDTFNNALRNAQRQGTEIKRTVQTGFDRETGKAIYENETLHFEPMPYIVIVIDEMADLMLTAGKEFEVHVQRLAQKARAAGIHLITATQRPSVDVVTGVIKANLPARLSYRVASKIDSRTVLNEQGAEHLLGSGDLLFNPGSGAIRAHGPFVADEEVSKVAAELRRNGFPVYVDAVTAEADEPEERAESAADELYADAVHIVTNERKATISQLQRKLSIGYNRAAGLIERLEAEGIIGPVEGGKRQILVAAKRSA